MPPPSKLAIATSSVSRLVKEETSYYTEIKQQEQRIKNLEDGVEAEITASNVAQEKKALEETHKVLPSVRQRLVDAVAKLEEQLEGGSGSVEDITKAKEAVAAGKKSIREIS